MTDFAKNNFAVRLVQLRRRRKLHQGAVAELLGMPRSTYAGYENGTREPNPSTLVFLASRLVYRVDYLTGNSDFELAV